VSGTAGRKLRGARGLTVACGLVLTVGLLASAAGLAVASGGGATRAFSADIGYRCKFPAATYSVSTQVADAVPASATVGKPIQPSGMQLTLRLPQAAAGYLRSLGATMVSASESLTVIATFGGMAVPAQWSAKTSAADALPDSGSLALAATGSAPPTTVRSPGTLTFTATGLDLALTLHRGTAASPVTVHAACLPNSDASAQLASIVVSRADASQSRSATPSSGKKHGSKFPAHCGDIPVKPPGIAMCGYIDGYSDVRKLYGAEKLGPGLINIDFAYKGIFRPGERIEYSWGELYYKGRKQLPPARNTFLSFRFVPVTATLNLIEVGRINIISVSGTVAPPYPINVTATMKVSIRLSGVTVNGKPLNVGPGCRTKEVTKLTLFGHGTNTFPPTGYTVSTGGPLAGMLTIPPFTDCGVTENLDPLLTGTISGPGNYVKMTQGELCAPSLPPADSTCPPPVPKPIR
jgi:hypothetical protein